MKAVSVRELRNEGGKVLRRVQRGETVTITMDGKPIAELRPLPTPGLSAEALVAHWRHLPVIDGAKLRADIDSIIDMSL